MKKKVYLHTCMCIMHELAALYIAQYTYVAMCRHMKQVMSLELLCMKGERDIALLFHKSFIHVRYYTYYMHPHWVSILILDVGITVCYFAFWGVMSTSVSQSLLGNSPQQFESGLHCGLGTLLF